MVPRVERSSPKEVVGIEIKGKLGQIGLHEGDLTCMLDTLDCCAIFFDGSLGSHSESNCGAKSLNINIVLDRGRNSEERGEKLFHIPLIVQSPVLLTSLLPFLVALLGFGEGKLEILLGDDAGIDSNCARSLSIDGQKQFRGDFSGIEFLDETGDVFPGDLINPLG